MKGGGEIRLLGFACTKNKKFIERISINRNRTIGNFYFIYESRIWSNVLRWLPTSGRCANNNKYVDTAAPNLRQSVGFVLSSYESANFI